jgi:hypothetical protein
VATEDLIKQSVQDFRDNYFACGQRPELCDPTTFTSVQGDTRPRLIALASEMTAQGLYFSQDLRGSYLTISSVRTEGLDRAMLNHAGMTQVSYSVRPDLTDTNSCQRRGRQFAVFAPADPREWVSGA